MSSNARNVILVLEGTPSKNLSLDLVTIDKAIRVKRAIKSLAIFWACAGFSIFIPMLHFVLVPGFFLAGLFFAANAYSDDVQIKQTGVPCLKCDHEAIFKNLDDQFPKWATCENCKAEIRLEIQRD